MVHHLPLGLRIGQQLSRSCIDPYCADTTEHAFSRQSKHDGDRPVNAVSHGQLRRVATGKTAEKGRKSNRAGFDSRPFPFLPPRARFGGILGWEASTALAIMNPVTFGGQFPCFVTEVRNDE